ncbi:MAG: glycosyltransferase family 4 protein [Flavobacteriales bacterium]|nr:glycosyltransferase family 4 protein [Flavobacteriales bacterium]
MRILQICIKPPFPEKDGYALAVNHISNALLQKGHDLKVIAISTPKHIAEEVPAQYLSKINYEDIFIDTNVKILPAFLNLFSKSSYNTNRFYSSNFANKLKIILKGNSFDIVLLEGLFVCPYYDIIKKNSKAKIILRAHNIESDIWKGLAKQTTIFLKKWYLNLLQKKLYHYEKEIVTKMDGIICISDKDANWMKKQTSKKIITIPFAIDTENQANTSVEKNTIFHIGSMDWMPNIEGVKWFLEKVFPIINQKNENLILHLAGRNMPKFFYDYSTKNIIVHGEVNNAKEFMEKHHLMIVPLWSGSGIRIKILEAMAVGKIIISTSIGADGINYKDKKNILIANTQEDFANKIIWCFENPIESKNIGENAKKNIQENYSLLKITEELNTYLTKSLKS